MSTHQRSTAALVAARRRDSELKRKAVVSALEDLVQEGAPITMLSVARRAKVSTWLVYSPGIREVIENARSTAPAQPRQKAEAHPTSASLRTDLKLARAEIRKLRHERDELKVALRRRIGEQVESIPANELQKRIHELTAANQDLVAAARTHETELASLRRERDNALDAAAATRAALKQMMRGTD